ncbi:MAG TPA: hypothetical protein VH916_08055, partial [Dehalococcoidia bacterium]
MAARGQRAHPYLVHGILFIPWERRLDTFQKLQALRCGYKDEIHYAEIKGYGGPKFRAAERWLRWFKTEGLAYCAFKVFAVDQEGFKQFPYPGEWGYENHLWKNTVSSFVAGLTWSVGRRKAILLDIVCDQTEDKAFLGATDDLPSALKR